MPRPHRLPPRHFTAGWPTTPATSPVAEAVRLLVANLRAAIDQASARDLAARTGVHHSVIARILAGTTWPDAETIARLETGLGVALWPTLASDGTTYRAKRPAQPRKSPSRQ
ncbi:helix-turn-helix domain-containing protein [Nocardia alni]|uniref:helix-turn-helix domain-containing protein n=1 Tax=Nocardia alni TaxID=2815723 RepID=UPI001C21E51D|nr:helix-turn-helix transcriptional regulator [Nocardia alni]